MSDSALIDQVRAALNRARQNVDLHIEREVFEAATARAVVQEFDEQFSEMLGSTDERWTITEAGRAALRAQKGDA